MDNIAQLIISGQNEINRMQADMRMLTGMLSGMIHHPRLPQSSRCHEFRNSTDDSFWRVTYARGEVWFECFGPPLVEGEDVPSFVLNWKSSNAPESEMTNGVYGVRMAYRELDVLVHGILDVYPRVGEQLKPFILEGQKKA